MTLKNFLCQELTVCFKSGRNGQHIRRGEMTACHSLLVDQDETRLIVRYLDKDSQPIKVIAWNFSEVLEYCCEGMISLRNTDE